ncbi:MAG: hypothetical protein JO128_24330, partial [Alphaproteobacteria bacterium]|nr:hypothetical protein [Alphaproteobacteria bacterium]
EPGFLFAGARPIEDYRDLVAKYPLIRDRPDEREPLLRLDGILSAVERAGVRVPCPRSWALGLDAPLPDDLTYPLFLRTAESSLKKGGHISRVKNARELGTEAAELQRYRRTDSAGGPGDDRVTTPQGSLRGWPLARAGLRL